MKSLISKVLLILCFVFCAKSEEIESRLERLESLFQEDTEALEQSRATLEEIQGKTKPDSRLSRSIPDGK